MRRARGHRGRRLQAVLLLLCLGLLALIYDALDRPSIERVAVAAPLGAATPKQAQSGAVQRFALAPLRDLGEVLERPVFSPTRRPAEKPAGGPAQSISVSVVGIVISSGGRHALIEHGQPPRLQRIAEGEVVAGWKVESILPDRVVLAHGDLREEVKPKDAAPKPARAPVPVAARPPARPVPLALPPHATIPPELAEMLKLPPQVDEPQQPAAPSAPKGPLPRR